MGGVGCVVDVVVDALLDVVDRPCEVTVAEHVVDPSREVVTASMMAQHAVVAPRHGAMELRQIGGGVTHQPIGVIAKVEPMLLG